MRKQGKYDSPAFTLVEVIIVLVIMGIIAGIAVPLYTSAATVQLRTAANIVASDLEYAKSMAISTGIKHSVVFNTAAESYSIVDAVGATISHPVHIGASYVVDFASDSRLNKVNIVTAAFNATATVKFDYLGAPEDGSGNALNSGAVTLQVDDSTMIINVEPVTGYISIE